MHKSFPFWPFLHWRFWLGRYSVWQSEGWVKNYNVKNVKTEITCAPPKTYQNQKSFWIPSNQPPNTCTAGWAKFFHKKHVFVKHPSLQSAQMMMIIDYIWCRWNIVTNQWTHRPVLGVGCFMYFWRKNEDEECSVHFSILGDCVTRSLEIIEAETHLVRLHKNAEGKKLKFNAGCPGENLRNGKLIWQRITPPPPPARKHSTLVV